MDLCIFRKAEHPSFLIQNFETQEGFSIFNLYDFTVTNEGRLLLKKMMSKPLIDVKKIN